MEFVGTASRIAREAGALLRDYYHKGVATEYKGDVDLVTEADRASEKLIVERLHAVFPEHGIYGEEGTRSHLESEYRWYIDPLDGTTNFAHGFPVFCVSMGLERRPAAGGLEKRGLERRTGPAANEGGEVVAGVIYDPLRDELFTAEKDKGAYLNGTRIRVSRTRALAEALVATGFPSRKRHDNPNIHFYQQFTLRSHGVRRAGSAALDLAYTACGRIDAYWEFNLNPWDTSAGALLVTEAGGTMSSFDGSAFRLDSKEVLATNGLVLDEMLGFFRSMFAGQELEPIPTPAEFAALRAAHSSK
jgi:myo-inositol-1(or 4)-monophosphatase